MMSRRLAIIPIVHTEADLGKLAARVRDRLGATAWRRRQRAVAELWNAVREWSLELDVANEEVFLYQDGLPNTGEAEMIVRDLATSGSVNHCLLLDLMQRGATLVGTEDPKLLLREYELANRAATGPSGASACASFNNEFAALLEARDAFIAQRIDDTLPEGATGVLFIGALHRVEERTPKGITLIHPLGRLDVRDEPRKDRRHAS